MSIEYELQVLNISKDVFPERRCFFDKGKRYGFKDLERVLVVSQNRENVFLDLSKSLIYCDNFDVSVLDFLGRVYEETGVVFSKRNGN